MRARLQSFPDFGDLLKLDPVVGLPQHDVTIGRHSGRRMHGLEFPDILPVFYIAVIRPADSAFIHRRSMEHEVERVRFADDIPVAYEIASIPEKIIRGFKESEITEHFFKTLTDNGYEIGKSQQTISASLANSSLAKHLKVKTGDALLSLTQISFLQDGQAFEYVRSYYVGDRFEFYLENN